MNEKELLDFISHIIASGNPHNIALSLEELGNILVREEEKSGEIVILVDSELLDLVWGAQEADRELAQLGKEKKGKRITKEELGKALREGHERNRRSGC